MGKSRCRALALAAIFLVAACESGCNSEPIEHFVAPGSELASRWHAGSGRINHPAAASVQWTANIPSELAAGATAQIEAAAYDSSGNVITQDTTTYISSEPEVATISSTGLLRAIGAGITLLTASVDGRSLSVQVAVVPSGQAATPAPSEPPAPGSAAAVLALVGPTLPVSQVPGELQWYEREFKQHADAQWAAFGPRWDAGNSISAYERPAIYYTWWARTGDTTYLARAHATAVHYRDKYLVPAKYATSPHWSQAESLYLDCIVAKDQASCDAIPRVATILSAFIHGYLTSTTNPDLEHRIQARVIDALWMAEKLQGSRWSAPLDSAIYQSLSTLGPNGFANFRQTCGGSLNFMGGILFDELTRISDQRPGAYNPAILKAAQAFATYAWNTQWRGGSDPTDKSFNYLSVNCAGQGSPTSAPDLNGLMLPLFGWLGKTTGDTTWFTRGDQVLLGMQRADLDLYRQFSESYSSSFRYLGYRYAR